MSILTTFGHCRFGRANGILCIVVWANNEMGKTKTTLHYQWNALRWNLIRLFTLIRQTALHWMRKWLGNCRRFYRCGACKWAHCKRVCECKFKSVTAKRWNNTHAQTAYYSFINIRFGNWYFYFMVLIMIVIIVIIMISPICVMSRVCK